MEDIPFSNLLVAPYYPILFIQASVREEISAELPYSLATCDGCGHCSDLHQPRADDPQPLKDLRERFKLYLQKWLETPSDNSNNDMIAVTDPTTAAM